MVGCSSALQLSAWQAGRIAQENEDSVLATLRAQDLDSMSFLDFLAYILLFIDIHEDINEEPITLVRCLSAWRTGVHLVAYVLCSVWHGACCV